jgi:hypothetical protein
MVWAGAVCIAGAWGVGLILFTPESSEFSALPLFLLGLPWSPALIRWLNRVSGSESVNFVALFFCGFFNAGLMYGVSRFLARGGRG